MSYQYDKNKRRRTNRIIVLIVFCLMIFFSPAVSKLYDFLEKPLNVAYTQVEENKKKSLKLIELFASKKKLADENLQLKNDIDALKIDNLRINYLQNTLNDYKISNGIVDDNLKKVPVEIILRHPQTRKNIFLVNKGSNSGLKVNDPVFVDYLYVGLVNQVFDVSSHVALLTNKDTISHGYTYENILDDLDVELDLNGQQYSDIEQPDSQNDELTKTTKGTTIDLVGHGNSYISKVSRESTISVGDVVYSQEYPGYIIAVVRKIDFDPREPHKTIYSSSPTNINNRNIVSVVVREDII